MFMPYNNALVLDQVGLRDVAAAYALRRLTANAKNAIKVRRSADNALLDIGFSNVDLDMAALRAFCGEGDGFVHTWYDQSLNGNHATQTTDAKQPRIVSSGTVDVDGIRPCIQTILSSDTHFIVPDSDTIDFTTNASFSVVHNPNSIGENNAGRIVDKTWIFSLGATTKLQVGSNVSNNGAYTLSSQNINTVTANSIINEAKYYINGSLNSTVAFSELTANSDNMYILNRAAPTRQYDGKISELILFRITLNDTQRNKLERNQGKYFNISIA